MLPEASIDGVHIFFPDPWHKKKHNKRRLIQPPLIAKLAGLDEVPVLVRDVPDEAGQLGGAKAAFTGNDFVLARVLASQRAHQNGLHDALGLDGLGQLVQRAFVHARARLVLAGAQHGQRQLAGHAGFAGVVAVRGVVCRCVNLGPQQGLQAPPQAFASLCGHASSNPFSISLPQHSPGRTCAF